MFDNVSHIKQIEWSEWWGCCCGRDRMVVGCITTYAIGAYHHWCWIESCSGRHVQQYNYFEKWLALENCRDVLLVFKNLFVQGKFLVFDIVPMIFRKICNVHRPHKYNCTIDHVRC